MSFFDIQNIAFKVLDYQVSYVELIGTVFGLVSVFYASRANILTWGTGIINEVFLFILFFQVQLYADMFLQVYFFIVTLYGWYNWKRKPYSGCISTLNKRDVMLYAVTMFVGVIAAGFLFKNIHTWLPQYFALPAAYPFADSFVMVSSIAATMLLAKKKIENWYLWFAGDVVCIVLYFKKQVYFLSLEYVVFLLLVSYGLYNWKKEMKHG